MSSAGIRSASPAAVCAAFNALVCDVAVVAPSGNVVLANEAWRRSAAADGASAARSDVGTNYLSTVEHSTLSGDDAHHALEGIRAVLSRRTERFSLQYPCHRESEQRWFQMTVTPCHIQGSWHAVVTLCSIDEQKRAEAELRRIDRRKEEFFATLLHELRNPLAPIANALELLGVRSDDPGTVTTARAIIQRQLRQLTRLVDDLLDVARINRGTVSLQREPVDIRAVVTQAIETARPLVELRKHQLATTLPEMPLAVLGDAIRLGQVFTNLLINAAKYTQPGGLISVIVERDGAHVRVCVRDNGIGISAAALPTIFEIFSQADPRAIASIGGLGVGLALARQLVQLHGGSIVARSEGPGQGSEFNVQLPLLADPKSDLAIE